MKSLTIDQVLKLCPCPEYTRERLEQIYRGRTSMTLVEILECLDIPAKDRCWLMRLPGVLEPTQLNVWLEMIVTRCIKNHALYCGVREVEVWARKWLDGTDRTKEAAEEASWYTLRAPSWIPESAAWYATWSAIGFVGTVVETAGEAAVGCAVAAIGYAAGFVDWDAAVATEFCQQIQDLRKILRGR